MPDPPVFDGISYPGEGTHFQPKLGVPYQPPPQTTLQINKQHSLTVVMILAEPPIGTQCDKQTDTAVYTQDFLSIKDLL